MKKYNKVLVANRGEIAVRIIRALKELGILSVAVYSNADKNALFAALADECICIGGSNSTESYLNTYKILSAAEVLNVDAVHPGIGFLAENADFAQLCADCNIDFIGPDSTIIAQMGNKKMAKEIASHCKIPTIPGSTESVESLEQCKALLKTIGYPALLKAAYGGGGKGIRVVYSEEDLESNYMLCVKEASAAFDNCELIVEKYMDDVRHIEVQVLGDQFGNVVHLFERECTIQRSNQKMLEEAPSVNISDQLREKLYKDSVTLAKHIHYTGPGTIEFLVLPNEEYYFLEMNTRLQVEHTITELITDVDIVKEQINIFQGGCLSFTQEELAFKGYALQCRILSEDPDHDFAASFGKITALHLPGGFGVRVDNGFRCNDMVPPFYDSLLCKICCHAPNKPEAIRKMLACLEELHTEGIKNNASLLHKILSDLAFENGTYHTDYINQSQKI